ncbi:hypothetical protein C0J52_14944, partial [Blattella germanica]
NSSFTAATDQLRDLQPCGILQFGFSAKTHRNIFPKQRKNESNKGEMSRCRKIKRSTFRDVVDKIL